ncbi:hypothetical protein BEWA_004050 [Theileria equi strain WA]|uniref:Uncharacterized protein n=1 Tax=Theileria equi strain WA TaxID=1537102 RepID=L0AZI0_THEEQ|nr:hypothetical protein BEWA_004050 [Theileria equi strain WA]AFZ80997.1 hypothetical protein BEWA_004050 [Theileria equi strain WA]|eukprot:XP_004830663.1 hypothetical protein BEWA_004050 [Theileria equi strain WA]
MTRTHTCTGFGRKYVDIDISKTDVSRSYKDHCRNTIKVARVYGKPEQGYKRYTHSFPDRYYISGIYYNRVHQSSIKVTDAGLYEKRVTVYYLDYDDTNAVPLIVGLEWTYSDKYDYSRRTDPLVATSKWKGEGVDVSQEGQLAPKLIEISAKLSDLVVLRLNAAGGIYYANGENNAPPTNQNTQIKVTGPSPIHKIYEKYTHTPGGGINSLRVLSTKGTNNKKMPFDPPVYEKKYSEVCVYYWTLDKTFNNPLLVKLGNEDNYYKYAGSGNNWSKLDNITNDNLKQNLDRQNCSRNRAHQIDISKNTRGSYTCPGCTSKHIGVSTHGRDYSYYFHNISGGGSICGFKDKDKDQIGITFTSIISNVYVYHYPKGSDGIPLLIYLPLSSSSWYQREYIDSHTWTKVGGNQLTSPFSGGTAAILNLLEAKLPTVTINIGQTNVNNGGNTNTFTYKDTSGWSTETIQITKQEINSEYTSFSQCVLNKKYFAVKNIKYNTTFLQGIPQNLVVKTVTAYYYKGRSNFTLDKLLLVELEKRGTDQKRYAYYSRGSGGSTWTIVYENTELKDIELTNKLKELKKKLEDKAKQTTEVEGASGKNGERGGDGVTDPNSPSFVQQILDFIRSKPAEIGGGVSGVLGVTGGLVGVAVWKGPALLAKLITRL